MVIIPPASKVHQATLIFLHGLGDTANGWAPAMRMLSHALPTTKFVLPTAPSRPVSLNYNAVMPAWYDIYSLDGRERRVDVDGIKATVDTVQSLVDEEPAGVRVIVGGFSQGGCIALATASSQHHRKPARRIDGCVCLSGYFADKVYHHQHEHENLNDDKPLPIFMAHGRADPVVSFSWAEQSVKRLQERGFDKITFRDYPGLQHGASDTELDDMVVFINSVISGAIESGHAEL